MSYTIFLLPQANNEAQDAADYYEEQKSGLGLEFLDELEACRKKLVENPHFYFYISAEKKLRSLSLKRFPYKLIYEISRNDIIVYAIYSTYKNPDNLFKRLPL